MLETKAIIRRFLVTNLCSQFHLATGGNLQQPLYVHKPFSILTAGSQCVVDQLVSLCDSALIGQLYAKAKEFL